MSQAQEHCTDTPNFLRLAQELNKFRNPYQAADMLLVLAGPMLEREKETQTERSTTQ